MARAVAEAPIGSGTVEAEHRQVAGQHQHRVEQLEELVDAVVWPTLAQRIREMEAMIDALKDRRRDLLRKVAALARPLVQRRLHALAECFGSEPLDIAAANSLLRQAAGGVTVDYLSGELVIDWHHGDRVETATTPPVGRSGRRCWKTVQKPCMVH